MYIFFLNNYSYSHLLLVTLLSYTNWGIGAAASSTLAASWRTFEIVFAARASHGTTTRLAAASHDV